jgi:hypothetical protein
MRVPILFFLNIWQLLTHVNNNEIDIMTQFFDDPNVLKITSYFLGFIFPYVCQYGALQMIELFGAQEFRNNIKSNITDPHYLVLKLFGLPKRKKIFYVFPKEMMMTLKFWKQCYGQWDSLIQRETAYRYPHIHGIILLNLSLDVLGKKQ